MPQGPNPQTLTRLAENCRYDPAGFNTAMRRSSP